MSGLEVIGGLSAILGIAGLIGELGQKLYRCLRTLHYARKEVADFATEVTIFSGLLRLFRQTATEIPGVGAILARRGAVESDLFKQLHEQSSSLHGDIKKFLYKVQSLRKSKHTTKFSRFQARVRWVLKKAEVLLLRASLESVKSSIQLFLNFINLKASMAELLKLQNRASEDLLIERYVFPASVDSEYLQRFPYKSLTRLRIIYSKLLKQQVEFAKSRCKEAERRYEVLLSRARRPLQRDISLRDFAERAMQLADEQLDEEGGLMEEGEMEEGEMEEGEMEEGEMEEGEMEEG